jgi:phosphoglycolate/pyridoxal phosphate phosphatase family enzyme
VDERALRSFLNNVDSFLLDCDGVLWRGTEPIPGVSESLSLLRSLNKQLIFVSNNSTKTRAQLQKKIQSFGIECKKEEVFGSAYAAAAYLSSINFTKKAYVVGENSIAMELSDVGIKYRGVREHAFIPGGIDEVTPILKQDNEIGAVIVGLDPGLSYPKIAFAFHHLHDQNCLFLATNTDSRLPVHDKSLPGAGGMVAALRATTGREPIILGKPSQSLLQLILKSCHLDPKRTCMVGDRLDTDILFGIKGGLSYTLLVMTGVTNENILKDPTNTVFPSHMINSLGDITKLWNNSRL